MTPTKRPARAKEGWHGWDEYAPFYDWENARTVGRRDVAFWKRFVLKTGGRVLELGSGTGRISVPLARAGCRITGIDRSAAMLARAADRATGALHLVRGDIRALPFGARTFSAVIAPYGIVQSLVRDRDLAAALREASRVLEAGGLLGIDLVPDVPKWREYRNSVQLRGRLRGGGTVTLIESVRQDRRRQLTTFDQHYLECRGGQTVERRFELVFRTLPVRLMRRRLERAGFDVEAVLGDYRGRPWDPRSDVWLILARRRG